MVSLSTRQTVVITFNFKFFYDSFILTHRILSFIYIDSMDFDHTIL